MAFRFAALPHLLVALAACGRSPAPDAPRPEPEVCQLAPVLERALGWSDYVVDCGALVRAEPSSAWQRARACVLTAQAAGIAYKLSYEQPSYDSLESAGIAGRGRAQPALFVRRSSLSIAPWRMQTSLHSASCADIRARSDCSVSAGEPCLECVGAQSARTLCNEVSSLSR